MKVGIGIGRLGVVLQPRLRGQLTPGFALKPAGSLLRGPPRRAGIASGILCRPAFLLSSFPPFVILSRPGSRGVGRDCLQMDFLLRGQECGGVWVFGRWGLGLTAEAQEAKGFGIRFRPGIVQVVPRPFFAFAASWVTPLVEVACQGSGAAGRARRGLPKPGRERRIRMIIWEARHIIGQDCVNR
ncbi:hypothetical protein LZ30DRAFT_219251 [Colletotrichum cereale]|nr:hypothetical protein LZ30DRAFT_219251 [Colletotrichum cereale]